MALNIKNPEVERLAAEVARITGETKTEAIRRALIERRARLRTRVDPDKDFERILRVFETEIWSHLPSEQRGRMPTKAEREEIPGYGPEGYLSSTVRYSLQSRWEPDPAATDRR